MDNYVGKVVKITSQDMWGHISHTGIVYEQKTVREKPVLSLIRTDGEDCRNLHISSNYKITSTKIEPELRAALKEAFKVKVKLLSLEKKYLADKEVLEKSLNDTILNVKGNSNDLTASEFMSALEELFNEKYPASGDYWSQKYFTSDRCSQNTVTMRQVQEVEKYANPEKFNFLYREYDNTIHILDTAPGFTEFCERHAPRVIPELAKHCEMDVYASLGDKDWLYVNRTYTFPLKYGFSKKSLQDIRERILGQRPSLDSLISSAAVVSGEKQGSGLQNSKDVSFTR